MTVLIWERKNMITYKNIKIGFDYNQDHGFANPQLAMIEGKEKIDELIELMSERKYYKPGLFYPTNHMIIKHIYVKLN